MCVIKHSSRFHFLLFALLDGFLTNVKAEVAGCCQKGGLPPPSLLCTQSQSPSHAGNSTVCLTAQGDRPAKPPIFTKFSLLFNLTFQDSSL